MGMFDYNLSIPAANNNPSDDQPLMQTNTNSVDAWTLVDHRGFNDDDALGGYHTNVHQVSTGDYNVGTDPRPPVTAPVTIPGINQLFVLNTTPDTTSATADTQLYALTGPAVGVGGFSQLTGNFSTTEGYQWIAGNLIQWGKVSLTSADAQVGSVTFKDRAGNNSTIPFPTNCFTVYTTLAYQFPTIPVLPTRAAAVSINTDVAALLRTSFEWRFFATASNHGYKSFFWVAIGN